MSRSDLLHKTKKIVSLACLGKIVDARKLFEEMTVRDSVAWNAMLCSYSRVGLARESLNLFSKMRISCEQPDAFSFTSILSACSDVYDFNYGKKLHCLIIKLAFDYYLPVCNALIDMYGKCLCCSSAFMVFYHMSTHNEVSWCSLLLAYVKVGLFENAFQVFHKMPVRGLVAWNSFIGGLSHYGEIEMATNMFREMRIYGYDGDQWTFASLMNASTESCELSHGRMIHACIIKKGWSSSVETSNSAITFYSKLNCYDDAIQIFKFQNARTQVSWNAMIDVYMKNGDVAKAFALFKQSPDKNAISWTTIIGGYAKHGQGEQALHFFLEMQRNFIKPDDFTFGAVLHACSDLAVLGQGRMIHGCIIQHGFQSFVYVGNGLVNMYAKCGDIEGSSKAFMAIQDKDLVSWNAMLFGFGSHGEAIKALRLFMDMLACGIDPDKVTFIGLLMACSHSGLVDLGQYLFDSIESLYGLTIEDDHVACMVDMLARAGFLKEARNLMSTYSGKLNPGLNILQSVLVSACIHQGEISMGNELGQKLIQTEPLKNMGYILLSNLYSAHGHWNNAEKLRKTMIERGVKKTPGCSWIEVKNTVMMFVAGSPAFPPMIDIRTVLRYLEIQMKDSSIVCFATYDSLKYSLDSFYITHMHPFSFSIHISIHM